MTQKVVVDIETGQESLVDLTAEELAAQAAQQQAWSESQIVYAAARPIDDVRLRTTDATPTELWRAPLSALTGYAAELVLIGVDAGNGAVRTIRASVVAKRLGGGAVLVGAPVVIANHADAAASGWAISASASGNDFVVSVTGAAGRAIDWLLSGEARAFTPGGR